MPDMTSPPELRHGRRSTQPKVPLRSVVALAVLVCLGIAAALFFDVPSLTDLRDYSHTLGPWFPFAFWFGYVVFTLFPIPRTIWTVSAGILFGPWWGLGISLSALTVSATLTVILLRGATGELARIKSSQPAVARFQKHLEERGWIAIFGLRMVAGVPFSILNYAAALSPIRLSQFALATAVGSIPTTFIGVFFGDALSGDADPRLIAATAVLGLMGLTILVWDTLSTRRKSSL